MLKHLNNKFLGNIPQKAQEGYTDLSSDLYAQRACYQYIKGECYNPAISWLPFPEGWLSIQWPEVTGANPHPSPLLPRPGRVWDMCCSCHISVCFPKSLPKSASCHTASNPAQTWPEIAFIWLQKRLSLWINSCQRDFPLFVFLFSSVYNSAFWPALLNLCSCQKSPLSLYRKYHDFKLTSPLETTLSNLYKLSISGALCGWSLEQLFSLNA